MSYVGLSKAHKLKHIDTERNYCTWLCYTRGRFNNYSYTFVFDQYLVFDELGFLTVTQFDFYTINLYTIVEEITPHCPKARISRSRSHVDTLRAAAAQRQVAMAREVKIVVKNVYAPAEQQQFIVEEAALVRELKQLVSERFPGSPQPAHQKLIFGGKVCADSDALRTILSVVRLLLSLSLT